MSKKAMGFPRTPHSHQETAQQDKVTATAAPTHTYGNFGGSVPLLALGGPASLSWHWEGLWGLSHQGEQSSPAVTSRARQFCNLQCFQTLEETSIFLVPHRRAIHFCFGFKSDFTACIPEWGAFSAQPLTLNLGHLPLPPALTSGPYLTTGLGVDLSPASAARSNSASSVLAGDDTIALERGPALVTSGSASSSSSGEKLSRASKKVTVSSWSLCSAWPSSSSLLLVFLVGEEENPNLGNRNQPAFSCFLINFG